jgi:hypothetical protein
MAKRKRRVAAQKSKAASKHTKSRVRGAASPKKATKRTGRKTAAKKVAKRATVKARSKKRTVRKKAVRPAMEAQQQLGEPVAEITETTVVDIIKEPAPGVVTVTEFEVVETTIPPEGEEGSGLAEGKDETP